MNFFYFFQKYLDKLNDVEFNIKWGKFVQSNIKRFMVVVSVFWLLGSIAIGYLAIKLVGVILGFFLMILFSIYFGYILFIQSIKFLGKNNTRYIEGKAIIDESVINYEDIVG